MCSSDLIAGRVIEDRMPLRSEGLIPPSYFRNLVEENVVSRADERIHIDPTSFVFPAKDDRTLVVDATTSAAVLGSIMGIR